MEKKVSVIIPCYNASKWLPQCFLSLAQQTMGMEFLELIFVDDASTDEGATWSLLLEFERAYPESVIIIQLEQNKRQGGARNEALKYASGEYIAFVDADDWVELDLYEKAYDRAKEIDADIVQFNHKFYSSKVGMLNNPQEMADAVYIIDAPQKRKELLISEKITYGCWNKIYKRELVRRANVAYAEGVIYEEPLFVYPLLYYGNRFVTMKEHFYIYRQNDTGTMHKDMKAEKTLFQHADVQLKVWQFMKQTEFFSEYYEELKTYFLHTYLFEILYFAKLRGMEVSIDEYKELADVAVQEVEDICDSSYESIVYVQLKLYRLIKKGITESELKKFVEEIPT